MAVCFLDGYAGVSVEMPNKGLSFIFIKDFSHIVGFSVRTYLVPFFAECLKLLQQKKDAAKSFLWESLWFEYPCIEQINNG